MISDQLTLDSIIRRSDALLSTSLGEDDVVMMDVGQPEGPLGRARPARIDDAAR